MPYEVTREQDDRAEAMVEKYGRAVVSPPRESDGSIRVIGLADDVEMEWVRVFPDGSVVSAEAERAQPEAA